MKVCAGTQHINYKFQELFTTTRRSLQKKNVPVTEVVYHLECLGSIKPTYEDAGQRPLRHQLPALANAKTVDEVMSVVKDYCPFFNYRMLEHIIKEFGTMQDKQNLAKYKEDFTRYAKCCVIMVPVEVRKMSKEGHVNMFVILIDDSFDNCTKSHLNIFIDNLRKTLNISSHVHLKLCRICRGSLILTFQLPISLQEKDLTDLGIVKLSCGVYQFTDKVSSLLMNALSYIYICTCPGRKLEPVILMKTRTTLIVS